MIQRMERTAETLGSMDEMRLGGAGERVRRCRPSVRLPLRRARRNRLRPRPALGIDYEGRRPNMVLLEFSRREGCRGLGTEPTQPGTPGTPGTADPAKLPRSHAPARRREPGGARAEIRGPRAARGPPGKDVGAVRRVGIVPVLDPVTEYGDPEGRFGYVYEGKGGERGYKPALAIDRSEWDDPDYMFLGGELSRMHLRRGAMRPMHRRPRLRWTALQCCNDEPGESGRSARCIRLRSKPSNAIRRRATGWTTSTRTWTPSSRTSRILASPWRSSTPSINACT